MRFTITRAVSGFSRLAMALSQLKSPAALRERPRLAPRQAGQKLPRRLFTQSIRVATDEDPAILRLRTVHQRHGSRRGAGMSGVQLIDLCFERL